ncbi:MAG TPA: STAS domain-containing protein [Anaerolineales bacterium]|nr:STAS domain-containing protein [Anaerolineales bacterium]
MEIKVSIHQSEQPIAILKIIGDINASNYMEVVNKAQELFDKPARNLIIDLSEVSSVSSTGLVALHKIALVYSGVPQQVEADKDEIRPDFTHSSNARKFVKLLNPQPAVDAELQKAGLKLFFKVFADLDTAINSF